MTSKTSLSRCKNSSVRDLKRARRFQRYIQCFQSRSPGRRTISTSSGVSAPTLSRSKSLCDSSKANGKARTATSLTSAGWIQKNPFVSSRKISRVLQKGEIADSHCPSSGYCSRERSNSFHARSFSISRFTASFARSLKMLGSVRYSERSPQT